MKTNRIYAMLALASLAAGVVSCSDDDVVKTPLAAPENVTEYVAADNHNTLVFAWKKVKDATQYGYEVTAPDGGVVVRDITNSTSVKVTDLTPDTEYTMRVWAYGPVYGNYDQSDAVVINKKTAALIPIAKPVPSEMTFVFASRLTWDYTEGADHYNWSVALGDEEVASGEVYAEYETDDGDWYCQLDLEGLANGSYKATVTAVAWEDGYCNSQPAVIDFTVDNRLESTVTGTYTRLNGNAETRTMEIWNKNRYRILDFYGAEGYNLEWQYDQYDATPMMFAEKYYNEKTYEYDIPTGLQSPATVGIDPWYEDSYMEFKSKYNAAYFMIGYASWEYDEFRWNP